jgi:zinc/manganese transport system substrate-binding protein
VTTITETLFPASASFQAWQVRQLKALAAALHAATGR